MKFFLISILILSNLFAFEDSRQNNSAEITKIHKVIYDLRTGNAKEIFPKFTHTVEAVARYYMKKNEAYKIAVVIGGDSYRFFVEDLEFSPYDEDIEIKTLQKKLAPKLQKLSKVYGVKFLICDVGVAHRDIPMDSLYNFVEAKKTRGIYLIEYQNNGYAYIPVH